jgi:hypothetical protein
MVRAGLQMTYVRVTDWLRIMLFIKNNMLQDYFDLKRR